jgi:hypothetical protein
MQNRITTAIYGELYANLHSRELIAIDMQHLGNVGKHMFYETKWNDGSRSTVEIQTTGTVIVCECHAR